MGETLRDETEYAKLWENHNHDISDIQTTTFAIGSQSFPSVIAARNLRDFWHQRTHDLMNLRDSLDQPYNSRSSLYRNTIVVYFSQIHNTILRLFQCFNSCF